MYFRTKKTPSGTVLQLVESSRDSEGRPRQRLVVSLGDAAIDEDQRPLVAKAVEQKLLGIGDLLPLPDSVQQWTEHITRLVRTQNRWAPPPAAAAPLSSAEAVLLDHVTHDSTAMLGGVLIALDTWRRLDMERCLEQLDFNPSQRLSAAVNVINRLLDPVSENALADWVPTTALAELLGEAALRSPRDRYYRASDKLLENRRAIETYLRRRQKELLGLERTLVLYDLTNTYFEGEAAANPKARRGKSKEKRDDCPQVVVGMVFDEYGFELAHEIFEGATNDSKTLGTMLDLLEKSAGEDLPARPLVILDGGTATKANRGLLRDRGYSYLVNETRTGRAKWSEEFSEDKSFELIPGRAGKSAVRVRLLETNAEGHDEQLLLCKSEGRREKEQAIRSQAEVRYLDKLEALARRVGKGKLKEAAAIERAIGRLLAQHTRVGRFYDVWVESEPKLKLVWRSRGEKRQGEDELLGCYVLRSDRGAFEARELWEVYMTLSRAEDGFRCLKSDLGLRPIRHHKEPRCDGHIFISVLAYHLLRNIMYRLEKAGDNRSWETIKRLMQTHAYATMVLPTLEKGTWRIRKAGQPDEMQKEVYRRLEVDWKGLPVTRELIPPTT